MQKDNKRIKKNTHQKGRIKNKQINNPQKYETVWTQKKKRFYKKKAKGK